MINGPRFLSVAPIINRLSCWSVLRISCCRGFKFDWEDKWLERVRVRIWSLKFSSSCSISREARSGSHALFFT